MVKTYVVKTLSLQAAGCQELRVFWQSVETVLQYK